MSARAVPRVLSIAGTDPTGGAGIQADLKSVGALGGYGMAVVTALVAQNTCGVREVHTPPTPFLSAQLRAVSDDVEIDAVKIGMLGTAEVVAAVAAWLGEVHPPLVVLDPVMVASSGDRLLDPAAEDAVRALCAQADLVTPNVPELAVLVRREPACTWDEALEQAEHLARASSTTVLLKGGHLGGPDSPDAIVSPSAPPFIVPARRVSTRNSHGTGCSLSSAMATLRAQGRTWPEALAVAKDWLTRALEAADALEVGRGNGPIDHFHALRASRFTATVWHESAALRARVDELAFVAALRDGSLDRADFEWYLAQDALYLGEYSRVLARASSIAPTRAEQAFWARGAATAIEEEARLHRSHIGDTEPQPSATTLAYIDHLHASAATGSYAVLVAALLPCYWLYADIGVRLRAAWSAEHPYADWLGTYGDPVFAAAAEQAVAIAESAADAAGAQERERMRTAFSRSMRHEHAFFEAPSLRTREGGVQHGRYRDRN